MFIKIKNISLFSIIILQQYFVILSLLSHLNYNLFILFIIKIMGTKLEKHKHNSFKNSDILLYLYLIGNYTSNFFDNKFYEFVKIFNLAKKNNPDILNLYNKIKLKIIFNSLTSKEYCNLKPNEFISFKYSLNIIKHIFYKNFVFNYDNILEVLCSNKYELLSLNNNNLLQENNTLCLLDNDGKFFDYYQYIFKALVHLNIYLNINSLIMLLNEYFYNSDNSFTTLYNFLENTNIKNIIFINNFKESSTKIDYNFMCNIIKSLNKSNKFENFILIIQEHNYCSNLPCALSDIFYRAKINYICLFNIINNKNLDSEKDYDKLLNSLNFSSINNIIIKSNNCDKVFFNKFNSKIIEIKNCNFNSLILKNQFNLKSDNFVNSLLIKLRSIFNIDYNILINKNIY